MESVGMIVTANGRLGVMDLDRALSLSQGHECTVDLRTARLVEPAGLVAIAAIADRATSEGLDVSVLGPSDDACRNYLARMGVNQVLDFLEVEHDLPRMRARDVDTLCELRWFRDEEALEKVANTIIEQYRRCGTPVVQPLYEALYELGSNAVEHSGRHGGYVALQVFKQVQDVVFAVGDSGVGLKETTHAPTDGQAIGLAAEKYQSQLQGVPGRGRGIPRVIELTERCRGRATFVTGRAMGEFKGGALNPRVVGLDVPFGGTLVETRLRHAGGW